VAQQCTGLEVDLLLDKAKSHREALASRTLSAAVKDEFAIIMQLCRDKCCRYEIVCQLCKDMDGHSGYECQQ